MLSNDNKRAYPVVISTGWKRRKSSERGVGNFEVSSQIGSIYRDFGYDLGLLIAECE
jgi:hypothetical protein